MTVEEKISAVLTDLATLSEAPASNFEPRTSHGSSSSKVPNGVAERLNLHDLDPDKPPSKERSLHDWWQWRFAKAVSEDVSQFGLYQLALLAERDYMTRRFHSPNRMALRSGEVSDTTILIWSCPNPSCGRQEDINPRVPVAPICSGYPDTKLTERHHPPEEMVKVADGDRAERAAAQRVVDLYEGVPANEVSVHENTTEPAIKKARRILGRNPQDGRPRAEFLDWPEDRRRREIAALEAKGLGQKKVADRLGVSKRSVQLYWPEPVAAAA